MSKTPTRILIIGAGYAGVIAAFRLSGKNRNQLVSITLVNGSDQFVRRLQLHEAAARQDAPPSRFAYPLKEWLAGTGVQFVQGWVTDIDPKGQSVTVQGTTDSQTLNYDYLVYALGSRADVESVKGVREFAYTLDSSGERDAKAMGIRLRSLAEGAPVVVIGGGATGIEAAAEIADNFPHLRVSLITQGEMGAFKTPPVQRYMEKSIKKLGVTIIDHTSISEVRADAVITSDGRTFPAALCLWAGGFKALPLAQQSGLTVNENRQILVDPMLRSLSYPNIYAVGDSAYPVESVGAPYRMSVFVALVTGAHAADNLTKVLHGKAQQPFGFVYYGQGIALGRKDAIGFMTYPYDKPIGPLYTGMLGLRARNLFVWLLHKLLLLEKRIPGSFFWTGKNRGAKALSTVVIEPRTAPRFVRDSAAGSRQA